MGCVESRLENDHQPNVFQVISVHERGPRQRSSYLEVTDTHIIQHLKGRSDIRWPLSCLRRYGFDAEKFSFEAGRRCPTGPGIYYFKCKRAEALFNLLQMRIQNIADDATSREDLFTRAESQASAATDSQGYLESLSRNTSRSLNNNIFPGSNTSSQQSVPLGMNGGVLNINNFPNTINVGRLPTSPVPVTPPAIQQFEPMDTGASPRSENRENPISPLTPGRESLPRDPKSPGGISRSNVFLNYAEKSVNFINHNERPSSYSSSGSDRPASSTNLVERSPMLSYHAEREMYLNIESKRTTNLKYGNMDEPECKQPLYINIDTEIRRDCSHVYANLVIDKDQPVVLPRTPVLAGSCGSNSSHSGTVTTTDTEVLNSQINYIQVDLDRGSDSSQTVPPSPFCLGTPLNTECPRSAEVGGYATIDFGKTEALISTAKAAAMWETRGDGCRRTRHNSTIGPSSPLGRFNATFSD